MCFLTKKKDAKILLETTFDSSVHRGRGPQLGPRADPWHPSRTLGLKLDVAGVASWVCKGLLRAPKVVDQ